MKYSLAIDDKLYKIEIAFDGAWIAKSPDIPGLICEESHLNDLLDSVEICAKALMACD